MNSPRPSGPYAGGGGNGRRRKKRSSGPSIHILNTAIPGTTVSGLNRNSIRVVELIRRSTGYGFTITGQKPCLLRCIVEGSPADLAGLRPGLCLVGVNGKDVSHLAHDEVVRIIGNSSNLLRLHVTDSHFSESSDDEFMPKSSNTLRVPRIVPRSVLDIDPILASSRRPSKESSGHSRQPPSWNLSDEFPDFKSDPNSLNEILGISSNEPENKTKPPVPCRCRLSRNKLIKERPVPVPKPRSRNSSSKLKSNGEGDNGKIQPIEVAVVLTPPPLSKGCWNGSDKDFQCRRDHCPSPPRSVNNSDICNSSSNTDCLSNSVLYPPRITINGRRSIGTRSLENLCDVAGDVLFNPPGTILEVQKGSLGSSTPALNQEAEEPSYRNDFWEFKVPHPPKPKMDKSRIESWSDSLEKLLADQYGMEVFTEFLEREFSAENIHFYTACLRFKDSYENLTQSQRISIASTIFQTYLQNGASDPINVDFQARSEVEKALSQPTEKMFESPLSQVFNLLKFDCYPRFLKSDLYRDYLSGLVAFPASATEPSDSDAESVKSHNKFDSRRRSLLPWNIKNRSKQKNKAKNDYGLNQDVSFIERAALSQNFGGSDHEDDPRRGSIKLCRVLLPDNSTTVLSCRPGETLSCVVQKLLEKREFNYSAFDVISLTSGKTLDLSMEAAEITAREIKIEPKAFIGIELPLGWKVGVRSNPQRKVVEVLKPILSQHSLKLDEVIIMDMETEETVDLKWPMSRVDGHNINVRRKNEKQLDENINEIQEYPYSDDNLEDDQVSAKTSSSHASSVFRGLLRRSKKYKQKEKSKKAQTPAPSPMNHGNILTSAKSTNNETTQTESKAKNPAPPSPTKSTKSEPADTNRKNEKLPDPKLLPTSPLSLIPAEYKLAGNSRNRRAIYLNQHIESNKA